jgi:hypothetical protein
MRLAGDKQMRVDKGEGGVFTVGKILPNNDSGASNYAIPNTTDVFGYLAQEVVSNLASI